MLPFLISIGLGQSSSATTSNLGPAFQAKLSTYAESTSLFAGHNYSAATVLLESGNVSPANTAEWHLESASQLTQMALDFRQQGDLATSGQIAQMALPEFAMAENNFSASTSAGEKATEQIELAFAYENLLGDRAQALACYQRAATIFPGNPQAQAGLARLTKALAVEARLRNHE